MGYRLLVIFCAIIFMSGCAALDHDNEPYTGFSPDEVPVIPGATVGVHSGYYSGTMTLDSNSCIGVSDEVNASIPFSIDVVHMDNTLNLTFEDDTLASGELVGDKAIFMIQTGSTKHVYYLSFSEETETVTGSCEVIEADINGQYADPCASYTISLEKGEKPAEEQTADSEAVSQSSNTVAIPLKLPNA